MTCLVMRVLVYSEVEMNEIIMNIEFVGSWVCWSFSEAALWI